MRYLSACVLALLAMPGFTHAVGLPPGVLPDAEAALTQLIFAQGRDDGPLACAYGAGPCDVDATHLAFRAPSPIPNKLGCQNGSEPLQACYDGAVTVLQNALDNGDVWGLIMAARRTDDVVARAIQDPQAPGWLKGTGPENKLARVFLDAGVQFNLLGNCSAANTTMDQRMACLGSPAGPPRDIFRKLIGLLDRHNDIKVVNGQRVGAYQRLEDIFRSATGPVTMHMHQTNGFEPNFGPGVQRVDLIAKGMFLKALEGTLPVDQTEALELGEAWTGYAPAGAAGHNAFFLNFSAQSAAATWDPVAEARIVVAPDLDADVVQSLVIYRWIDALGTWRDDAVLAAYAQAAWLRYGSTMVTGNLSAAKQDAAAAASAIDIYEITSSTVISQAEGRADPCGWWTVEDVMTSLRVIIWETHSRTDTLEVIVGWEYDEYGVLQPVYEYQEVTVEWTETSYEYISLKLGERLVVESIVEGYRALMDSDDPKIYDPDRDGTADMHYLSGDGASVGRGGINPTPCLDEFSGYSSAYGDAIGSLDCGTGDDCTDSSWGYGAFLPYAVAVRVCPDYTSDSLGLTNTTGGKFFADTPVTLKTGGIISVSTACTTVYGYTSAVADLVTATGVDELLEELHGALSTEEDNGLHEVVADFAAEALLITQPVAGFHRQRADMAYFGAEYIADDCADTGFADCHGLDVLEARLDKARSALDKGFDLVEQFASVDWSFGGAPGNEAIPDLSQAAYNAGGGAAYSAEYNRSLWYLWLKESMTLYDGIVDDQFEVIWRRLDGFDRACLVPTDTDGDGAEDDLVCDSANADCTDACTQIDDAEDLLDAVNARTGALASILADHAAAMTAGDLQDFVSELGTFAGAIAAGLSADFTAMESGLNWLGHREGLWRVYADDDAESAVTAALASLEADASSFSASYDNYVNGYLSTLADMSAFGSQVSTALATSEDALAGFCADSGGSPDVDGCGAASAWDSSHPLVTQVNDAIDTYFCNMTVELDGTTYNIGADAIGNAEYVAFAASAGIDPCPTLEAIDVETVLASGNTGSLMLGVQDMANALYDVEWAARDLYNYLQLLGEAQDLMSTYTNALGEYHDAEATREAITDGVICGVALAGATVATIFSIGMGSATYIGAAGVCASRYADDVAEAVVGDYTAEDLALLAAYTDLAIAEEEMTYTLMQKIQAFVISISNYKTTVLAYRTALADFEREKALVDSTFETLYTYGTVTWTDPTFLLFENQELAGLKADFKGFASDIDLMHQLVQYDIGHAVPQGSVYARKTTEHLWIPRLAEVTILAKYAAGAVSADYVDLETSVDDGSDVADEDLTLVAMASLLGQLHADFVTVFEERRSATAWISSDIAGVGTVDNPGEKALLGDSRFYAAVGATGSCTAGQVDLNDYCPALPDDTCFAVSALTDTERLSLAYADHMVASATFAPITCVDNGDGTYTPEPTLGSSYDTSDVGAAPTGAWYRDVANGVVQSLYDAQTPVVQAIMDAYVDALIDEDEDLPGGSLKFYPGNFAFRIDMSSADGGSGRTTAAYDPEAHLLYNAEAADATMAEQLEAMVAVCTSSYCANGSQHYAGLVLLGDTFQGDSCRMSGLVDADADYLLAYSDATALQERVPFQMNHKRAQAGPAWTYATTDPEGSAAVAALLADTASTGVGNRPLHVDSMLLVIGNAYDANGNPASEEWPLHYGTNADPRLRIGVDYSYYSTSPSAESTGIDTAAFLSCYDAENAGSM